MEDLQKDKTEERCHFYISFISITENASVDLRKVHAIKNLLLKIKHSLGVHSKWGKINLTGFQWGLNTGHAEKYVWVTEKETEQEGIRNEWIDGWLLGNGEI